MNTKWDALLTGTLVGCALLTTGLFIHREFASTGDTQAGKLERKPSFVKDWQSQLQKGTGIGPKDAPVQLIEFADFECPYCGTFHATISALKHRYPEKVSLTYVDFPLPGHRFAMSAARVAGCANQQGRFEPMYDQLYEQQGQFGIKTWTDIAHDAGVTDLVSFESCLKRSDQIERIEEGKRWGTALDVKATPTILVNGWMLGKPPSLIELETMVEAILAGKSPLGGTQ
jgi:protein-disulfide isomerase